MDGLDRVEVRFTQAELWCLRGCVRHEWPALWEGKWPPYSYDLNEAIALALADTFEGKEPRAIPLCLGDCLAIDYTVENNMPSSEDVLKKVILARKRLVEGEEPLPELREADVDALLESVRHENARGAEGAGADGAGDAALA